MLEIFILTFWAHCDKRKQLTTHRWQSLMILWTVGKPQKVVFAYNDNDASPWFYGQHNNQSLVLERKYGDQYIMWTRWSWRWWNCWEWFLVSPICVKGLETGKSCLVVPDFMRKMWVFCWKPWKPNLEQRMWQKTWYYSLLIEKVKKKTNIENVQKYLLFV